jgi:2-dehydro-3-deoxy-D-arabinonate dehydratase
MRLYRTTRGVVIEQANQWYALGTEDWDELINRDNLASALRQQISTMTPQLNEGQLLPPIQSQEVWAAGVTYLRSRDARIDESKDSGASNFYDRVYAAQRPELFFKSMPQRVVGHGGDVRLRSDSKWIVPEPELALLINSRGSIVGYTIGNDMSCRDIEGENPLYLPQAKIFDGACALGPGVLIGEKPLDTTTSIHIHISRNESEVFHDSTSLARMRRRPDELADWLFREQTFPAGCYLLTGTGVVPPDTFSLKTGDEIRITIDGIGELLNRVAARGEGVKP